MGTHQRPHGLRRRAALVAAALSALTFAPPAAAAEPDGPLATRAFAPVMEATVRGDLLLAGNSNLISAGGWGDAAVTAADVDGDRTNICALGLGTGGPFDLANLGRWLCADNSSSAELDLPAGAPGHRRPPLRRDVGATPPRTAARAARRARRRFSSTSRCRRAGGVGPGPPKLYEAAGGGRDGAVLRQAVWDVTAFVAAAGPGTYTVADIVNERVGPLLPYASWAIVAAYELDPALDADGSAAGDPRFAPRFISWHDGFQHLDAASLDVPIRPPDVTLAASPFAKSFHVVARGRSGRSDNLLFADAPTRQQQRARQLAAARRRHARRRTGVQHGGRRAERLDLPARHRRRHEVARGHGVPVIGRRCHTVVGLGRRHGRDPHPRPLPPRRRAGARAAGAGHRRRHAWPPA